MGVSPSIAQVTHEARAERKATSKYPETEFQRRNAPAHLARILDRNTRLRVHLIETRSASEDCVPSIWDESTASFRTKL